MNTKRQELLEKKRLSKTISDWADKNKKIFWKYEVSSFYQTYIMRVANLPTPSKEDINISKHNRLLTDQQKTQLCNSIGKIHVEAALLSESCIDVQIDYVNGAVIAKVI